MPHLLPTAILAAFASAGGSELQIWNCEAHSAGDDAYMSVSMSFWGPRAPIVTRPYLSISVRDFSYDWNPGAKLLSEPFRDPDEIALPVLLQRKPRFGHVSLTARGEQAVRLKLDENALLGWNRRHGAYLRLKDPEAAARLLRVSRWTATVRDRRGRVQEVATIESPSREEVRQLYDLARREMVSAARDPARSPLCKLEGPREDEEEIT